MFTGIVQEVGRVVRRHGSGLILKSQPPFAESGFDIGESIAVNGVCLTLLPGSSSEELMFEVSPETFSRSALGVLQPGDPVNLERALTLSDRLGGHIVQGHVDCVGECVSNRREAGTRRVRDLARSSHSGKHVAIQAIPGGACQPGVRYVGEIRGEASKRVSLASASDRSSLPPPQAPGPTPRSHSTTPRCSGRRTVP
jgi:hypothetical protein